MITRIRSAASVAALMLATAFAAQDAAAQTYATSAGWGGGFMSFQPFAESGEHTPQEIGLSSSWVAVATAESWQLDSWLGLRLGGSFSRGAVAFPTADRTVSAWGLEGAALLRVMPPAEGRTATAYAIAGGGFMWFNLGAGAPVPIAGTGLIYDAGDRRQPMAMAGGGLEFMTSMRPFGEQLGIRVEGVDQVTFGSPLRPVGSSDSAARHNLRLSVTLFSTTPGIF
jgi:hypothetical protein